MNVQQRKPKTPDAPKENPAIRSVIAAAEKKYGPNALVRGFNFATDDDWNTIQRFPTGIPSLDLAVGGGFPVGRYTEIDGAYSSGKTTTTLHAVRGFQQVYGKTVLFCDVEGTTDPDYLRQLEIHEDLFVYNRGTGLEEVTQMVLDVMDSPEIKCAVIDSLEMMTPLKEYASEMDDSVQMGIKPKLLSEFFRKYQAKNNGLIRAGEMPFTLIGLNQLREKIGTYGDPEYAPGGRGKDHAQSLCVRLRATDYLNEGSKDKKKVVGRTIRFRVTKNKTFSPGREGEYDLYTDDNNSAGIKRGFVDAPLSIILCAMEYNLIQRAGAWYTIEGVPDQKFQGQNGVIDFIKDRPDIVQTLQDQILSLTSKR